MDRKINSKFSTLRSICRQSGRIYTDPDFPADRQSLVYNEESKFAQRARDVEWKRPYEICENPQYIVDGATRFDLDQGELGNCWFVAAAATVATKPKLFQGVVPLDQGFGDDYAGIFRFNFWRFGKWVEVIIDDRLPTKYGAFLAFCKNREQPNEFWSALLEKAYAKLHRSYEALSGGKIHDAICDMTGATGEFINLEKITQPRAHLFQSMIRLYRMDSLMGCSIEASKQKREHQLENGLVMGHAYSITSIVKFLINGEKVRLLRIRNPWGKHEWNGPWSDGSPEWETVDESLIEKFNIRIEDDGEFWMTYEDWLANFTQLQICHLTPDSIQEHARNKMPWCMTKFHGSWIKGLSAGGCGNAPYQDLYWSNPQFRITLTDPDMHDNDNLCTVVLSLMQKYRRALRTITQQERTDLPIGFDIYKVQEGAPHLLDGENYSRRALHLERRIAEYGFYRENTARYRLEPGNYVVIPATFKPEQQADFLLRVLTEKAVDSGELDVETGPILKPRHSKDMLWDQFKTYAGNDGVVDARELRKILNETFKEELGPKRKFSLEAARSLLVMMDHNQSGSLEFDEVQQMTTELKTWQGIFNQFDRDGSGDVNTREMRQIFKAIGFNLSRNTLQSVVLRYGGKSGKISFNDFILVQTKVVVMFEQFSKHQKPGDSDKAELTLDEWMRVTLFY